MPTVGLPRALSFLQHYPLWRTFFEALDVNVVVSPPTNREMLTAGAKVIADVTCLPVKVYAGHVIWLRDHGQVDFVFTPAIWSLERDSFHCAKLKGLPDIIKATVPHCPPLLDIEIDPQGRKLSAIGAFRRLGHQFTWNPAAVHRAWARACEADDAFQAMLRAERLNYLEALARLYPQEWSAPPRPLAPRLTVGVVGHPYCLYDDYLNHGLLSRLYALEVDVLTSEMVTVAEAQAGVGFTTRETRWFYENSVSGAGGHYLLMPEVDGLIATLAFACGPDSTMVETLTRRAHAVQRPFMSLILDEHGSATGMVTRLEAFVDMLARQKQSPPHQLAGPQATRQAPAVLRNLHTPVVGFPRVGTLTVGLKSILKGIGARVELGPPLSAHTVLLGARYSPEFICTPYKYFLGGMMEMLDSGADTLLYMEGRDLCRNSSYAQMLQDALQDLNYKFRFASFAAIYEGGAFALPEFLRQFAPQLTWQDVLREFRLALAKMSVLDALERQVQYTRPREITSGAADKVWEEAILRLDAAADTEGVHLIARDVSRTISHIPLDTTRKPIRVVITGEYYAVLEPFFNLDLERELGKLGAEVHRGLMMSEWIKRTLIYGALHIPTHRDIARAAKPYLRWDVSGEGWVTVGQTILHAQRGFDGVVEALPFSCEPEITALNILPRVTHDYGIPVISFIFDEQSGKAGMKTRLEAFVDLLFRRRDMHEAQAQPECPPIFDSHAASVCARCPLTAHCQKRPLIH